MPAVPNPGPSNRASPETLLPIRRHKFPTPKLRLHLNDLDHEGSAIFLSNIKGSEDLETQVQNVLNLLYDRPVDADAAADAGASAGCPRPPPTRSVTLILRDIGGVAYTTGTDLDADHKEIHLSLSYVRAQAAAPRAELLGVLCHELVHCFQWDACGTCPGGLIEGIADWVRLRAGLGAKHWRQEADGNWDAGYQHTGYFLEYLEQRFGEGTVRRINGRLGEGEYDEKKLFQDCCGGHSVDQLWKDYGDDLKKKRSAEVSPNRKGL